MIAATPAVASSPSDADDELSAPAPAPPLVAANTLTPPPGMDLLTFSQTGFQPAPVPLQASSIASAVPQPAGHAKHKHTKHAKHAKQVQLDTQLQSRCRGRQPLRELQISRHRISPSTLALLHSCTENAHSCIYVTMARRWKQERCLLCSAFLGFLVVWRQASGALRALNFFGILTPTLRAPRKVLLNKPRGDFREEAEHTSTGRHGHELLSYSGFQV